MQPRTSSSQPTTANLIDLEEHPQRPDRRPSGKVRTRVYGSPMMAGMFFEVPPHVTASAEPNRQPSDDEIIIVSVRLSPGFGQQSAESRDELPSRPQPRSYLRRVSTRLHDVVDKDTFRAVQMPRRDYKRWFRRDRNGNYTGTEPERRWTQDDVDREFGRYQNLPLRSIFKDENGQTSNQDDGWVQFAH